jgi:hypothetical protein
MVSRAGLDAVAKKKILSRCKKKHGRLGSSLVTLLTEVPRAREKTVTEYLDQMNIYC